MNDFRKTVFLVFIHLWILLNIAAYIWPITSKPQLSHFTSLYSVPYSSDSTCLKMALQFIKRDKPRRESLASKLEREKHQLEHIESPVISRLWEHNTVVQAVTVDSHTSLPSFSALVMEELSGCSRCEQAAILLPRSPLHNRRIEGSPKLKALLSLRLVAMERLSDRLNSLCCLGWPWLKPIVRAPSRYTIQSCGPGPSGTRACTRDKQIVTGNVHSPCGEWTFL